MIECKKKEKTFSGGGRDSCKGSVYGAAWSKCPVKQKHSASSLLKRVCAFAKYFSHFPFMLSYLLS